MISVRFPEDIIQELRREAKARKIPYARYMRTILKHRKLLDMGNPEFVKDLYLK